MESIGTRIKSIRTKRNITLSELAEEAGVAKSYLSNVERGIQSNPSIQFIEKMAAALKVPVQTLLHGVAEPSAESLDPEWAQLVKEAMASGVDKQQFKEFLEFQKWKKGL